MRKISLFLFALVVSSCSNNEEDNNSNVSISEIAIGTQIWQSKNLDVTTYRDGTPIPQVTDPTAWVNLTTGAWCYYNNTTANGTIYGKLYNWYAVAGIHDTDPNTPNKVLAPQGWHVPSDAEWTTLTTFLGGVSVEGGKMKSIGTIQAGSGLWQSPSTASTNESSFSGHPGGRRVHNFSDIDIEGHWWSSSAGEGQDSMGAWNLTLYYDRAIAARPMHIKWAGLSVRCLRD